LTIKKGPRAFFNLYACIQMVIIVIMHPATFSSVSKGAAVADGAELLELLQLQAAAMKLQDRCHRELMGEGTLPVLEVAAHKAYVRHGNSSAPEWQTTLDLPAVRLLGDVEPSPVCCGRYGVRLEWELNIEYFVHIEDIVALTPVEVSAAT
jgi:hypothetical protein